MMIFTSATYSQSHKFLRTLGLLAILLAFTDLVFSQVALVTGPNGLDLQQNALLIEVTNNSTAPVVNELVILTTVGTASEATVASTTSKTGIVGICLVNCATTGTAVIATAGVAACKFDNATTAGDYVQAQESCRFRRPRIQ